MSSSEVQRTSENQENRSSDTDKDTQRNFSGQRSLDMNIQSTGQQSLSTSEPKKIEYGTATGLNISRSASRLPASSMKENKGIFLKGEKVQNFGGFMSQVAPCSSHPHERPHNSNISTPEMKQDDQIQASEPEKKAGPSSSITGKVPFKGFALSASDLPIKKGKLAKYMSLEEACGFLPNLMKTKRCDLKGMENQLDQVSVDLQKALRDAKNISILLENAPKDVPQDITAARVQAQKLTYLLSKSYRIFERLYQCGIDLKEKIQEYSKQTGDYHSSVDVLLEYIMENILEKTRQAQGNF